MSTELLQNLVKTVESIPDPLSKQGVAHPCHGMVVLVLLGLVAGMPYVAPIRRWAEKHGHSLQTSQNFKKTYPSVESTI